jgi:DNA-binding beta-propeller fold protein YncE
MTLGLAALGCGSQEVGYWGGGEEDVGSVSQPLVYTPRGPGWGNLTYNSGELFQRISLVNSSNGVPSEYPGLNLGYMFNGYFVGIAARDHGWSGGAWVVLNVSNPRSPTSVVTLNDSACTGSGDCFYNGYLNGVQNPGRPGLTGDFRELHGACFTIMNNRWYAAIPSGYGIEVWDFTDVNTGVAPTRTSRFAIPGIAAGDYTDTSWQLTCQAPYVYVANANQGVSVISIANPSSPLLLSRTPISQTGGFRVGPIFTQGNLMVVSSMDTNGTMSTLDISDPTAPSLLDTFSPGVNFYATCFNGNEVIFTQRGTPAYMQVANVQDPTNVTLLNGGTVSNPESLYCSTQGDTVMMGNQEEIAKFDITNPSNPVLLGEGNLNVGTGTDHGQVTFFGNTVYVGNDHGPSNGFIVHQLAQDTTAPSVASVSPKNGTTGQGTRSRIGLVMTDNILIESMGTATFIVRKPGGSALAGTYSGQANVINFTPSVELEPNTTYEVVVPSGGLSDWSGRLFGSQFTSTFTTGNSSSNSCLENCPIAVTAVSASTAQTSPAHPATDAIDGNLGTRWTASSGSVPQWLQLDHGSAKNMTGAKTTFEFAQKYDYRIETSTDGTNWTTRVDRTNNSFTDQIQTVTFSQVSARYMRIYFTGVPANVWPGAFEFRALGPSGAGNMTPIPLSSIKSRNNNECADVSGNSQVDGGNIATYGCHGGNNQQFSWQATDSGYYKLVAQHSLKCADVSGNSTADGANIHQWACGAGTNQQWKPVPTSGGYFRLEARHSAKCMAVDPATKNVYQATCAANNTQEWSQAGSPLTASLTGPGPKVVGTSASYTATGSGGNGTLQYSFAWGDGTAATAFSTSNTASHTFNSTGHFAVVVTVKDGSNVTQTANYLQTAHNALTASAPTKSGSITYYSGGVFAVNTDNDSLTKMDGTTRAKSWEVGVGDNPTGVAVSNTGNVWVVNHMSDSISVRNSGTGAAVATYYLPRGSAPYGVAFSRDGNNAYVTLQASGRLLRMNPSTGAITGDISVGSDPRGIAVTGDSSTIYVTRFRSPADNAEVRKITASTFTVASTINLQKDTTTVDAEDRAKGVPNYLVNIGISPDGNRAWVPSQKTNTGRGNFLSGQNLVFDAATRAIVSQINLSTGAEIFTAQNDFNDSNLPMDVAFTPLGDYAFMAIEANNEVAMMDSYTNADMAAFATDRAPNGLVMNDTGTRLYVHNFMGRNIDTFDTSSIVNGTGVQANSLGRTSTVATEALSAQVLNGKRIFYNAEDSRMARDGYLTCASCHLDGHSDNRVWDFTERGEGLRHTIDLTSASNTLRAHWTANFDEIQDFENDIRNGFGGTGLMSNADFTATSNPLGTTKAGRSADLDALAAYVATLTALPRSPHRNQDASMTTAALAGKLVFDSKGCGGCHGGTYFTDLRRHDVGTIQASSGQGIGVALAGIGFDTPSLMGLWNKTRYLHNGQGTSLNAVLNSASHGGTNTLSSGDRTNLEQYLLQLDSFQQGVQIPARLEAEHYARANELSPSANSGGQCNRGDGVDMETTGDSQGGVCNIGYAQAGEWVEFDVYNATAGTFSIVARVANGSGSNKTFRIEHDGVDISGTVTVPTSGWQTYADYTTNNVSLPAGSHTLRFVWITGDLNLNFINVNGIKPGFMELKNRSSGLCADISGNSTADGANANTFTCNGGNNQKFDFQPTSSGYFRIVPRHSYKCGLDVSTNNSTEGANIHQWSCGVNPNNNQQWIPVFTNGGYFELRARHSNMCAGIDGTGNIVQQACTGATGQQWTQNGSHTVFYRIKNRWQSTSYMQDGGTNMTYSTGSDMLSHWEKVDVDNTFKLLRNRATGHYANIAPNDGTARADGTDSAALTAHWSMESTDPSYFRIVNRNNNTQKLHVENLTGNVQHGVVTPSWHSAQWILEVQ